MAGHGKTDSTRRVKTERRTREEVLRDKVRKNIDRIQVLEQQVEDLEATLQQRRKSRGKGEGSGSKKKG